MKRNPFLVLVQGTALLAFAAGGVLAAAQIVPQPWVREFQAGAASPWQEKALAVTQRSAFEGVGFAAIAAFLGLVALALSGGGRDGARFASRWLLAASAFVLWVVAGTWFFEAALPFLRPGTLVLLDLVGFSLTLSGWLLYERLVRAFRHAPQHPFAASAGAVVALSLSLAATASLLLAASGSWRQPWRLGAAFALLLLSLPAAGWIGRGLEQPVRAVGRRLAAAPLLPRPVALVGLALLGVAVALSAATFQHSALPADASYSALESSAPPERPNVVLVTIDTLRADHLGCYGYGRSTSPFLDSMAAEGTRCADPVAPAAWTKPSTGTILTGLYPSRHGALYHGSSLQLPEGERTLAEAFRDAGYATAGFVSNPNVKRVFDFDRGFLEFFDSPVEDTVTLAAIRGSVFGRILMALLRHQFNWNYENDAQQMNRHVLSWLEENHRERFFLYVHYIDPHIPYDPPEPYRLDFAQDHGPVLFNERKELVGLDLYDGEIRYADDALRQLAEALQRHGVWEDTLLVVTSDHGEEFFEHGILGHGFSLYQPVVQVPLLLRGPGVAAGNVVERPVALLDLAATLVELAGVGDGRFGDGRSFAPLVRGEGSSSPRELVFLENEFGTEHHDRRDFVLSGARSGPWKLVLTEEHRYFPPEEQPFGGQALYNLAEDPGETENLIAHEEHRERVEELLRALRDHSTFLETTGFRDVPPAALDPQMEASLRALGYL